MQRAVRLSEIIDHRLAPVVVVVAAQFFFRLCSSRYLGSGNRYKNASLVWAFDCLV